MVEARGKGGRKMHYCIPCHEGYLKKLAQGG